MVYNDYSLNNISLIKTVILNHNMSVYKKIFYKMWNKNKELCINNQIHIEYWASYRYHLLWSFFDKDSIGLKNIANFF